MNVDTFFKHWGITENPYKAEEAREDPVYRRIMNSEMTHPDFEKIYGSPDRPGPAVVFGEKGSGKTAIRLLMEDRMLKYNEANPDGMTWVARYDDLNSMLDCIARRSGDKAGSSLSGIRLADHMDSILSIVTTRLVDFLLGDNLDIPNPRRKRRRLKKMSTGKRLDLAVLALIYDQKRIANARSRWRQTLSNLRVGRMVNLRAVYWLSSILLALSVAAAAAGFVYEPWKAALFAGAGAGAAIALIGLYRWMVQSIRARKLARWVHQEVQVIERQAGSLRSKMGDLPIKELLPLPLPLPGDEDSRYDLTHRLMAILEEAGFISMVVLMDRVDEPALVNGQPGKMRSIVWPMLNNKFLQQEGIGFKLLLPIELSHLLRREDEDFFQQARLDKQNMIERLVWSGSSLYDICTKRLIGCGTDGGQVGTLTDLFEEDVTAQHVMEALDQMKQPRDAFKFLYRIIQEHCQNASDENPQWRIPRSVLDQIRKQESQRVQDLYRGLAPA